MIERDLKVRNRLGLHARAASKLASGAPGGDDRRRRVASLEPGVRPGRPHSFSRITHISPVDVPWSRIR